MSKKNINLLHLPNFSLKGQELVSLYTDMAVNGYDAQRGNQVEKITKVYSDFELHRFRTFAKDIFVKHEVRSVLDYGCGGSDWETQQIFDGKSAKDFFNVQNIFRYEPARNLDERRTVDLVSCFDVLEHIHVLDVPLVVRELFSLADHALLVNIACYPASARLPNGENAHITVREPAFWLGVFSSIAIDFPEVEVNLLCSKTYKEVVAFPAFSAAAWANSHSFCT